MKIPQLRCGMKYALRAYEIPGLRPGMLIATRVARGD